MAWSHSASGVARPDGAWRADQLADGGPAGKLARSLLRAHLVNVGWFELERRRAQLGNPSTADATCLVDEATDAACTKLLGRLGDYRGQSRFHVWAAKFAIHEVAEAARRNGAAQR